jgi:CNT family concentrative nucleoside transporter
VTCADCSACWPTPTIAIHIGSIGGLAPERRGDVAQLGLKALLAGSLVNLANAAIAGVVAA